MKIRSKKILSICCGLSLLWGCGDFLEEQSQDLTYATNCNDLEELLVGGGYAITYSASLYRLTSALISSEQNGVYFPGLHVMDDDVEAVVYGEENSDQPYELLGAFYRWATDPCNDGSKDYEDPSWGNLYIHIVVTNAVLDKVDEFAEDSEEDRNCVKGQAYFLRAYYYFFLINMYAEPYSSITATEDLGVPLKNFAYIDDRYWGRATVQEVYDQIIADLQEAIRCFEGQTPKSVYWAGEDAARLLLGRVYCYTEQWDSVAGVCEELLNKRYSLANLVVNSNAPYISTDSPEVIFTMGDNMRPAIFYRSTSDGLATFCVSDELFGLYGEGDMRKSVRFTNRDELGNTYQFYSPSNMGAYTSEVFTLRLSEVYLNLAEAYMMTGNEERARELLQELRSRRIEAEHLGTVSASGEDLIRQIREERRRELCFEGHRWFDIRRYGVCPNYPESKQIVHPHYSPTTGSMEQEGMFEGNYVLPGYPDRNYVLPIPRYEIEENQGHMEGNDRNEIILS